MTENGENRPGTHLGDSQSDPPASSPDNHSNDDETVVRSSDPSFPTRTLGAIELPEEFGRYRIIRTLGAGGMGSVFLAEDTQLQRMVALKVPHFTRDGRPAVIERFYREARSMATLNHPNLCSVFDVGEIDGHHYLTMAYIEGRDLSEILPDKEQMAKLDIVELLRKLAAALGEAHSAGVVHRDLKPSNIIIDQRAEPIVMDFGLARRDDQGDPQLTREGAIVGTPSYMSPEQVEGDPDSVGPTSDIYSLGVMFYQLLCGRTPFSGNVAVTLAKILSSQFERPSSVRPDIDPALEAICLQCMARSPSDRYESMEALVQALDAYRGQQSIVNQQLRRQQFSAERPLVPGYQYDLAISFLTADDEPAPGQIEGWITTLIDNLVWRVKQLGGYDQGLCIWLDDQINETPSEKWQQQHATSAMHLLVVSPGFFSAVKPDYLEQVLSRFSDRDGLFVVERDAIDAAGQLDAMKNVRPIAFWVDDGDGPRILGHPRVRPEVDVDYYGKVDDVARRLHARITELFASNATSVSKPKELNCSTIFLAEVTDDLDASRTEVERYLSQFDIAVRPTNWYPRDEQQFRAAVEVDLEGVLLFVQLLSGLEGKRPPQGDRTYAQIQSDMARQAGIPILQWRSNELVLQDIPSDSHRDFVNGDRVQAVELEQFKRTVVQTTQQEIDRRNAPPQAAEPAEEVFVFVNVERGDSDLADDLCQLLDDSGCSYATPIYEGRPDEIRQDLEANLLDCDGLIVVYGATTEQWVREQLRQWRKIIFRREKPLRALAIFEGPPPVKGRLGMRLPKMKTIDCRNGLERERIQEFIDALLRESG